MNISVLISLGKLLKSKQEKPSELLDKMLKMNTNQACESIKNMYAYILETWKMKIKCKDGHQKANNPNLLVLFEK